MRAGERVDNSQLIKFAKLFNDELTLDNLERVHLVNLCRFVGITPFGTDEFLRSRLRARLSAIKVRSSLRGNGSVTSDAPAESVSPRYC